MREKAAAEHDARVKRKVMGWKHMAVTYGVMLLLVGVQMGIIVFPGFLSMNEILQVVVIMGYWAIVAALFTVITN